ncbi:MAG: SDR family oxidoreductase [Myxococcales bacterium]|nr:MAG: SDR family oxidoreductase [Myxococcales bacterium]
MKTKKITISGASGLLGAELTKAFCQDPHYTTCGVYHDHRPQIAHANLIKADLTQEQQVEKVVELGNPDVIIHCAGMVSLLGCEQHKERARSINVEITRYLAQFAQKKNAKFIFISSDFVFDGKVGTYTESSEPRPLNYYGETKVEGETLARAVANHLVIRTTFFGTTYVKKAKQSYNEWIESSLNETGKAFCYINRYFSPVSTITLSSIIKKMVEKDVTGVYNVSSDRRISRFEFAQYYAQVCGLDVGDIKEAVDPVAIRPFDLSLDNTKVKKLLGLESINVLDEIALLRSKQRDSLNKSPKTRPGRGPSILLPAELSEPRRAGREEPRKRRKPKSTVHRHSGA